MPHDPANKFELNYLEPNSAPSLIPTREFEKKLSLAANFSSADRNIEQLLAQKWVIHIHAYYIEELAQLFDWLSGSVHGGALVITTDTISKKQIIAGMLRKHVISNEFAGHEISVSGNSGRNVSALMLHLAQEFQSYDLVLHLHTKRSPYNSSLGASWFRDLVACLANSKLHVEEIRYAFAAHQNLGIVIPRLTEGLRQFTNWGQNYDLASLICSKTFINKSLSIYSPLIFPAGMMFWFRPQAMRSFCLAYENCLPLPSEPLAIDGTCLHALERIVLHACELDGYSWAISYPEQEHTSDAQPEPHRLSVWEPRYKDYLNSTTVLANSLRQAEKELGACKAYLSKRIRSPHKRFLQMLISLFQRISLSN
jgi:lipopolysaccharide biosynthesis protein